MPQHGLARSKTLAWLLSIAVLVGGAAYIPAADTLIVVPQGYTDVEAAGSGAWPSRVRAQFIYAATEFDDLPNGGAFLTGIKWRPDTIVFEDSLEWSVDELTISASVTTTPPSDMNLSFAANVTGAVTVVRQTAPWSGGTNNSGPPSGPKEFDIEFVFETPFHYDPADGNLLLEMVGQGPDTTPVYVWLDRLVSFDTAQAAVIVAWDWPVGPGVPTEANGYVGGIVAQLTFAPLPGDYDGDGDVDGRDFIVWQRNPSIGNLADWQASYGTGSLSAVTSVPEPGSMVLVGTVLFGCRWRRGSPVPCNAPMHT